MVRAIMGGGIVTPFASSAALTPNFKGLERGLS